MNSIETWPPTNYSTISSSHLFEKELHLLLEFKDPHHSIGRGLLQGWTCDIDNSGQRAQERATRPQGGDVFLSAAGRLSVTRNHATVWIIEYWVREFHHDSDTEAHENQPRVLWENSDNHALYSKTRDLTPINPVKIVEGGIDIASDVIDWADDQLNDVGNFLEECVYEFCNPYNWGP